MKKTELFIQNFSAVKEKLPPCFSPLRMGKQYCLPLKDMRWGKQGSPI
jgi:hypothetical protein